MQCPEDSFCGVIRSQFVRETMMGMASWLPITRLLPVGYCGDFVAFPLTLHTLNFSPSNLYSIAVCRRQSLLLEVKSIDRMSWQKYDSVCRLKGVRWDYLAKQKIYQLLPRNGV